MRFCTNCSKLYFYYLSIAMLLKVLATFFVASTAALRVLDDSYLVVDSDEDELSWAESYSVKATRISLLSNIVEDMSAWKTNQSSRVDYNQGTVKVILNLPEDPDDFTLKFEIRPETTEEKLNAIACHLDLDAIFSDDMKLDDILPPVSEIKFEAVGNETTEEDLLATKFEYIKKDREDDIRKTIWAYYSEYDGWIPVKYEVKKYNAALGSLYKHELWTFSEYQPGIPDDAENIFDTDRYGCNEAVKHSANSEKVVKEMLFINPDNEKHVDHVFNHFKNRYNRQYAEEKEHNVRRSIFKENMRMVSIANRRNLTYKLGINQFSDWTPEEKKMSLGAIPRPKGMEGTILFPYSTRSLEEQLNSIPKEYDMRISGIISPVKNQEHCGSCWTFAASAVVESGLARINGGRVLSLSNQAIVDCAYEDLADGGAGGCNGGFDFAAYNFIMKHGLPTDEEYGPYKMRDGFCNIGNMTKTYSIKGYTEVTKYSDNAMKVAAFKHGPLFIYVHASEEFHSYSSGIFYQTKKQCNPERPNHAVVLVGYGERYGDLYWILKNSWGTTWGQDGYMLVAAKDNVCGVSSNPSYPVF